MAWGCLEHVGTVLSPSACRGAGATAGAGREELAGPPQAPGALWGTTAIVPGFSEGVREAFSLPFSQRRGMTMPFYFAKKRYNESAY